MAGSLNKVMLIGNLGKDPEIKTFEGGGMLARFPMATSETYTRRDSNEKVTNTEWHTAVCRRGLAEVAEKYLKKGDKVFVEGRIRTRSWDDANGEKRYTTEIQVDNLTMLGSPNTAGSEQSAQYGAAQNQEPSSQPSSSQDFTQGGNDQDDDLPF